MPLSSGRRRSLRLGGVPLRPYVVVPILLISVAVGALAIRSYRLAAKMENGLNEFAVQYLAYVAEITARRLDAAVSMEMTRAFDEWQRIEREVEVPSYASLQKWLSRNPWVFSAIYLPDVEPEHSIFVSSSRQSEPGDQALMHEFYTASGTLRYTYDPALLLARARRTVDRQPAVRSANLPEAKELSRQSQVTIVATGEETGLIEEAPEGLAFAVPLAPPLGRYTVRSSVRLEFLASSWQNHKVISLWLAAIAIVVTAVGAGLAIRGVRRESEATQLRAALIANVSHELRTPLSMIRLGAETLKRGEKLSSEQRLSLNDAILREAMHLTHLVENVLDIARLQKSGKPPLFAPVDPGQLVNSVLDTYDSWVRSKGFTVVRQVESTIGEQLWERESVSRALLNLVDNAIKYSRDEKKVTVSLFEQHEEVVIAVHDSGVGIDAADIDRIFDPYYRARFSDTETRRGAGLGLTLVQQIVASHGGRVEVESTPGVGSIFRLHFPRRKQGADEAVSEEVLTPSRV